MKIEYKLEFRRRAPAPIFIMKPPDGLTERPHRIARILALAYRLDELVRSGAARDHGELARLGDKKTRVR